MFVSVVIDRDEQQQGKGKGIGMGTYIGDVMRCLHLEEFLSI